MSITYKDLNMTASKSITLDPYTGYEFSDITEIMTTGGRLYLIGAADDSRYTYSMDLMLVP